MPMTGNCSCFCAQLEHFSLKVSSSMPSEKPRGLHLRGITTLSLRSFKCYLFAFLFLMLAKIFNLGLQSEYFCLQLLYFLPVLLLTATAT